MLGKFCQKSVNLLCSKYMHSIYITVSHGVTAQVSSAAPEKPMKARRR